MIVEINDMTTPMLQAIRTVSREVAFEQMSKIGSKVKENAAKRMKSSRRHHWLQKSVDGMLVPDYDKTKTKELGQRTNPSGKVDDPSSMGNMIGWMLMEKSGVLIVGGKSPTHYPIKRRDGEKVGVMGRQSSITAQTQSIIHKLDVGERNKNHGWGYLGRDIDSMPNFKGANYKGRYFMNKGFGDSIPYMKQELSSAYVKTVGRAVNKVKVKLKPSKRTVA